VHISLYAKANSSFFRNLTIVRREDFFRAVRAERRASFVREKREKRKVRATHRLYTRTRNLWGISPRLLEIACERNISREGPAHVRARNHTQSECSTLIHSRSLDRCECNLASSPRPRAHLSVIRIPIARLKKRLRTRAAVAAVRQQLSARV